MKPIVTSVSPALQFEMVSKKCTAVTIILQAFMDRVLKGRNEKRRILLNPLQSSLYTRTLSVQKV